MCEKLAYNYGETTPDLDIFILNYIKACNGEVDCRALPDRILYDQKKLELGDEGLSKVIEAKMGMNDFVLLKNDFPYNNLMPKGSRLEHYCLWSKNESRLTVDAINKQIEEELHGKPAFIFRHGGIHISIKKIPHVHIILDANS